MQGGSARADRVPFSGGGCGLAENQVRISVLVISEITAEKGRCQGQETESRGIWGFQRRLAEEGLREETWQTPICLSPGGGGLGICNLVPTTGWLSWEKLSPMHQGRREDSRHLPDSHLSPFSSTTTPAPVGGGGRVNREKTLGVGSFSLTRCFS